MFVPPTDLVPVRTADGSYTLDSATLGEHYHSLYGALTESRHVYIEQGLLATGKRKLDILEVGLGTGLNALLTWSESDRLGINVNYWALEPFPLPAGLHEHLHHTAVIGAPERQEGYTAMMNMRNGGAVELSALFHFHRERREVQHLDANEAFDLVYFDAFAPAVQPDMWTVDVFRRVYRAMRPEALMVTYCAKGDVRRAMIEAGLRAERVPGPPGKYRMLKAIRPR
ncbi:MAG: tRNA (5-methylaminomethyl-2-thiouridine)(34)-methyltransferase MnmD [Flavobacteriales bacterium]|nr:tRNA (5-methylaminomethyl-2-thiouridine)(34)-methyltransferase MnmD [Flavobacteriales bacterium]